MMGKTIRVRTDLKTIKYQHPLLPPSEPLFPIPPSRSWPLGDDGWEYLELPENSRPLENGFYRTKRISPEEAEEFLAKFGKLVEKK